MIFTETFIKEKFNAFNKTIFENRLPKPIIQLSRARSFLGRCIYRREIRSLWVNSRGGQCTLRFSTSFDLPESELEDVIIHEMIHYRISYDNIKDTSSHGVVFKQMMNDINRKFGRNICVRTRIEKNDPERRIEPKPEKQISPHIVAVVKFKNGKTGVKVLPRIGSRIANFYNKVSAAPTVDSVHLYFTLNVYFDRFPNSSVLKVHIIDPEILEEQLKSESRMYCKGNIVSFDP